MFQELYRINFTAPELPPCIPKQAFKSKANFPLFYTLGSPEH